MLSLPTCCVLCLPQLKNLSIWKYHWSVSCQTYRLRKFNIRVLVSHKAFCRTYISSVSDILLSHISHMMLRRAPSVPWKIAQHHKHNEHFCCRRPRRQRHTWSAPPFNDDTTPDAGALFVIFPGSTKRSHYVRTTRFRSLVLNGMLLRPNSLFIRTPFGVSANCVYCLFYRTTSLFYTSSCSLETDEWTHTPNIYICSFMNLLFI